MPPTFVAELGGDNYRVQKKVHCRTNHKSSRQSFMLGVVTCWSLVLINTVWSLIGWFSRGHQRKLPQNLLMSVVFAAKHFHQLKHNKQNIISSLDMIHLSSWTIHCLLRTLQGVVCGSCCMFLRCHGQWARLDRSNFCHNQWVNKPTRLSCPGLRVLNKDGVNSQLHQSCGLSTHSKKQIQII